MSSPFADVLRGLAAAFADLGVGYYLFGAQAALVYGAARLTADVDVTVRMNPEDPRRLLTALETHGFASRVSDDEFIVRTRVLPLIHRATGINADVVLAGPGIEELFLRRAQPQDIDGVRFPVACPEDLIAMKILSGRPKDLQDVAAIVEAQDTLDAGCVRDTLSLLESALDQRDLTPQFEAIYRRSRG